MKNTERPGLGCKDASALNEDGLIEALKATLQVSAELGQLDRGQISDLMFSNLKEEVIQGSLNFKLVAEVAAVVHILDCG